MGRYNVQSMWDVEMPVPFVAGISPNPTLDPTSPHLISHHPAADQSLTMLSQLGTAVVAGASFFLGYR